MVNHISVIGEACRSLSNEFQAENTNFPWADIIGMRNILVHHYFGIDEDAVLVSGGKGYSRIEIQHRNDIEKFGRRMK